MGLLGRNKDSDAGEHHPRTMNLTALNLGGEPRRSSLTPLSGEKPQRRGSFADRLSAENTAGRRGSTEMLDRLRDARWRLFERDRSQSRRGSLSQEKLESARPRSRALKLEDERTRTLDRDKTGKRSLTGGAGSPSVERRGSMVTRWYRLIKEAADAYQGRDGKGHKRTESAHTLLQPQDSGDATPSPSTPQPEDVTAAAGAASAVAAEGAEAALSPAAASAPGEVSPAQSPTAARSQLAAKAAAGSDASSPGERRRMQRVEMLKIAESTQLIDPAEVVVSQGVVLSAEPVLTPIERLRRKDEQVRQTLTEKQQLVADILQIPRRDFQHIAELAAEPGGEKDARELILNSILSVDRNMFIINETLKVTEGDIVSSTSTPAPASPDPALAGAGAAPLGSPETGRRATSPRPSPRRPERPHLTALSQLLRVNSQLSATLTTLLGVMTERDEERERMRKELRFSHERIHQLHREAAAPLAAAEDRSRPQSFVSVASSAEPGPEATDTPAETDDESTRSRPDANSQESGGDGGADALESSHQVEACESASSSSACLTFESAADLT